GVRPRSRPSTSTVASAGVDRTNTRPRVASGSGVALSARGELVEPRASAWEFGWSREDGCDRTADDDEIDGAGPLVLACALGAGAPGAVERAAPVFCEFAGSVTGFTCASVNSRAADAEPADAAGTSATEPGRPAKK